VTSSKRTEFATTLTRAVREGAAKADFPMFQRRVLNPPSLADAPMLGDSGRDRRTHRCSGCDLPHPADATGLARRNDVRLAVREGGLRAVVASDFNPGWRRRAHGRWPANRRIVAIKRFFTGGMAGWRT
jgi:hypothetical protein